MEHKAKIRIPTTQYGFIEAEITGTSQNIVEQHDYLIALVSEQEGLDEKEWARFRNKFVQTYKIEGDDEIEQYENLSKAQKYFVNQFKLAVRSSKE